MAYKNTLIEALAGVVIGSGAWGAYQYFEQHPRSDKRFKLCLSFDKKQCPAESTYIQGNSLILIEDWINKECAHYKRRNSIVKNGLGDTAVADVTCTGQ